MVKNKKSSFKTLNDIEEWNATYKHILPMLKDGISPFESLIINNYSMEEAERYLMIAGTEALLKAARKKQKRFF